MISTLISSKVVATAFAAAAMSMGVIAWSAPAEARFGGGQGFHGGSMAFRGGGFTRHGFVRHGFAGPVFARPGFAHRAVFFHGRRFHHSRFFFGPAFALGIGAPYYYNNSYYDDDCYYVWRRRFDPWGYVVTRRVLVCP